MNELIINSTQETPEINFNPSSGILKISGRAYSYDINVFYKTIDAWLTEYLAAPNETTTIEIRLEYSNSIFSKLLLVFFEKCKTVIQKDKKLILKWYHEKDDRESVDDSKRISKIIKLPIETIEF
ncbi:MAG: SiaC family regulatory phosphoprotein [Bacteroidia bacterium]